MLQLTGIQATMQIAGAGPSKGFDFTSGGKQGGVETPDLFNAVMEYLMEPLAESWTKRSFGVKRIDQNLAEPIHHLVWADNVWLLAEDRETLQIMLSELTASIYDARFKWKVEKGNLKHPGRRQSTARKTGTLFYSHPVRGGADLRLERKPGSAR